MLSLVLFHVFVWFIFVLSPTSCFILTLTCYVHSRFLDFLPLCVSPALISTSPAPDCFHLCPVTSCLNSPVSPCSVSVGLVPMQVVSVPAITHLVSSLIYAAQLFCKFCSSLSERFSLCLFLAFLSPRLECRSLFIILFFGNKVSYSYFTSVSWVVHLSSIPCVSKFVTQSVPRTVYKKALIYLSSLSDCRAVLIIYLICWLMERKSQ